MSRLILLLILLVPHLASANVVEIQGARLWIAPDQTQLVIDANGPLEHKIFPVSDPERLIIDIPDGRVVGKLPLAEPDDQLVKGVRSGVLENGKLRIVIDLKQSVRAKSALLEPNERYGHRLVVDLIPKSGPINKPVASAAKGGKSWRDLVIAIDAGHGGDDPGAIGPGGALEKEITIAIARRLAGLIDNESGMRAVLVRDGDYYLGLSKRMALGRAHNADLFISIHADAYHEDPTASGSSVFVLSREGATSNQAKWLAESENNADRIGGINFEDSAPDLSKTLWEMARSGTLEHSGLAAQAVLSNLGKIGAVHHAKVQKAGFVVLKIPDIPSVLVETAFLSNAKEEKRLKTPDYQQRLATAILSGIKAYFATYPPPGTRWASKGSDSHLSFSDKGGTTEGRIAQH